GRSCLREQRPTSRSTGSDLKSSQRTGDGRRRDQWRGGRVVERVPEGAAGLPRQVADDTVGQLNQLPAAAAVLSPDGHVRVWNGQAAALLGWKNGARPRLGSVRAPWLLRLLGAVEVDGTGAVV